MDNYIQTLPRPIGVAAYPISLKLPFLDIAGRFSDRPGTVLLASGGSADSARHHMLAVNPWLTITSKNNRVVVQTETGNRSFSLPPLTALKKILCRFRINDPGLPVPAAAGLFGYLAYDLKDGLEALPRTAIDDLGLPDMYLTAPRLILAHDNQTDQTLACVPVFSDTGAVEMTDALWQGDRTDPGKTRPYHLGCPTANFRENDYKTSIKTIIDYIAAGDVYQVNLSQRFEAHFSGDPFGFFKALFSRNPAPFFAYINAGDHHIVSTSPERFVKQTGRCIETRPIKGTRPRGKTASQDRQNRDELLASEKDEAELSMIVDLMRNDLGKVCQRDSVRVVEHKRLEPYDNVFHLVSVVEGLLADGKDSADIMGAVFPGGSITGCPKIRSMEIIDELEPCRRHIYTGSIGYISFHDTMDLSIAIRTAVIRKNRLFYSAGGGIVFDSDPDDEYRETLAKAATVLDIMEKKEKTMDDRPWRWVNGRLTSDETIALSPDAPVFQYGAGLFETIRADNGQPGFPAEHLARLTASWEALFCTPAPDITWEVVIDQILKKNRLTTGPAAVKIMAAPGNRQNPPYDHTLVVAARPYIHRLTILGRPGLELAVYPHCRRIHTANHKTMNYLFYHLAGRWAAANGADEALIMNPDQTVSETNTANILLIHDQAITVPVSASVLPGITQKPVLQYLTGRGFSVRSRAVTLKDCFLAREILLTNSLMGAVSVLGINGKQTGRPSELCREINDHLGITA